MTAPIDIPGWRKAMEGVPDGPWIDGLMGHSEDDGEIYYVRSEACSALEAMTEGPDIAMASDHLVAQHIRRCSPTAITVLLDALEASMAREAAAEARVTALEAEKAGWIAQRYELNACCARLNEDANEWAAKARDADQLTEAMTRAACRAFYRTDNIDGVSLAFREEDHTFRSAFAQMWKAATQARQALSRTALKDHPNDH